ncbi:LysE family translocator [Vibrio gazogenes]|uniref:Threonine/homoserine/homoserine lactone efflux protein n=1 Tax=Vibrio gazogenes DSM 21264 = NBRC 103151 TaxID=1123492 RepID=A0A1M4YUA2_VIBGA|nr:LysE family translocator [Vibrio gazogenes]USP15095.1 LysE family translocator [Vibrio gazogenes]SHF09147.1 Threonine/homoserine/homoserine lactone efflux protein [Vibrio gazogenes DSM 21264] [Vibrio gazogenes DSM 21264 = NBRC 103151]
MNDGIVYFLISVLIINLSPGPAMLYVMNQSLIHGFKTGIKAAAGVEVGVFFYVLLTALGLVVVFQKVPILYEIMQICGAIYLLYLAYSSWPRHNQEQGGANGTKENQANMVFRKGVLINITNPKIGLFFLSLLPQFVPNNSESAWMYFLAYGLIFNLGGIIVNTTVGLTAQSMKSVLSRLSWFDYVPPILFFLIAVSTFMREIV